MEQMIVFIYDTSYCQTEEDDPQKAVLFFHPNWVSDQQRLALCGQLMGAAHFCASVFSTPRILTLQSGKFVLKKFGQYILSVGSDQTSPDWILNERFNILQSLLQFYHKSFDAVLSSVNSDYDLFVKKLHDVFEVYSPIIQYVVSTFGNIPAVTLPRKKSSMFLEAFQLLESCCAFEGVSGGTILHNSRVIATLLDSDITKLLALTDPYRIRSAAEQIQTPFHLPLGVQLIKVYVKHNVIESSSKVWNASSAYCNGNSRKQDTGSEVKQDIASIFTVPEEEGVSITSRSSQRGKDIQLRKLNRQKNKKNSKSKIENALKERSKNFVANYNIKICSTPTVEKKIVHEDLLSICNNPKVDPKPVSQSSATFIPDLVNSSNNSKNKTKCFQSKYTNNLYRLSMDDLMIDFTYKNYPVPLRYYSFGLPKICKLEPNIKDEQNKRKLYKNRFYKTIADPLNPVFRFDGFPVSKSLYNHCLDEHYKDFITANITIDSREEYIRRKNLENEFKTKKERIGASNENQRISVPAGGTKDNEYSFRDKIEKSENSVMRGKELNSINQKLFRRSLTLPLRPATHIDSDNTVSMSVVKNKVLNARTPTTPLMTKLSLLVLEEQNEAKNFPTSTQQSQTRSKTKSTSVKKQLKILESKNPEIMSCVLFVCGQENLTMLLLLDETMEQNPHLILSLWEICNTNFEKIEQLRNKSIDNLSNSGISNSYNFLSLDPQWGTMQKSGTWSGDDMKVVGSLHQDLIQTQNITEIIIRNEDAVIYGYRCGNTETFYQQGGCSAVGLPTPADLMGVVPLKARRRLERDYSVVLL